MRPTLPRGHARLKRTTNGLFTLAVQDGLLSQTKFRARWATTLGAID